MIGRAAACHRDLARLARRRAIPPTRVRAALALALAALAPFQIPASAGTPEQRTCDASPEHRVAPSAVALNGRATVTLTLTADCSSIQVPAHVILVFDNSVAMGGVRMNYMKQAVEAFVGELDFSVARVGLVAYSQSAQILAPLTEDPSAVIAASQQFFPRSGSNLTMGLRAGRMAIEQGRALAVVPAPEEVMILMAGSQNDGGPEEALAEAQIAKDAGITLITIAAGIDADPETLEQIATSPSLFHSEGTGSRWASLYVELAQAQGSINVTGASVTSLLPESLGYVFGSGFPSPRIRGQEMGWQFGIWPAEGLTIQFQVEARALGRHPVSEGASADLVLDRGPPQRVDFPIPDLEVVPGPSATTPPETPTPTPAPTERIRQVYLPMASRGECLIGGSPVELIVVVDTSSTMMTALGEGVRLDYVLHASARLLDSLRLPVDSGGIVTVASDATVLRSPTTSRAALISALGGIYTQVGSGDRLETGLTAAARLPADPTRRRFVVAITDGGSDPAAVHAAAERVRSTGATLVGVAFGPDIPSHLAQIMFGDGDVMWSESGTELIGPMGSLARAVLCSAPLPKP